MSDKIDPSLTGIALDDLPPLDELVQQFDPQTWTTLKPLLKQLGLLGLLTEILGLAWSSEMKEKRALLDLARLAVAKHPYTKSLYSELLETVTNPALIDADLPLPNLPKQDARLAMEMLTLMGDLFALNKLYEQGLPSFRLAEVIADRFDLFLDKGIIYHQLGSYELQHEKLAQAEAALQKAAQILTGANPELQRRNNYQRAVVYKLRLDYESDPPAPEGIETIIAHDPAARELVLVALAGQAVSREDFATAGRLLNDLRERDPHNEHESPGRLLVEAKLARRNGEFEKAELFLKRAAKSQEREDSQEIAWESFYLARDLGHVEESNAILERLKEEGDNIRIDYQRALVAYNNGDRETAERLFRSCLQQTDSDNMRADCMGMLALVSPNFAEARRFLHEALGLYVLLGRKLDHAISLSHLAAVEFGDALMKRKDGWPKPVLAQFRRADNLFRHAQEIAESLGASSFLLDLIMNRARLEMRRERYNAALDHFSKAATSLEVTYLTMTDQRSANLYLGTYTAFYELAIDCALSAAKQDTALLFSERSKARRFLRDAAETTYSSSVGPTHSLSTRERELLTKIQPLRARLIQRRSLALQERQLLYDAEQELRSLWRELRRSPELSTSLAKRVHQPLEVEVLRQIVFGEEPEQKEEVSESDEPVEELPGSGVMQCKRCFVYNRIASSFCSACDALLPKSASVNFNLLSGGASEEELKRAFADKWYNEGIELFHENEIAKAEPFFEKAMSYATHPDYTFLYALCRLFAGDAAAALRNFDEAPVQQYSHRYPFWPLPVSIQAFHECIEGLRRDQQASEPTFVCLMNAWVDYSRRREVQGEKKLTLENYWQHEYGINSPD